MSSNYWFLIGVWMCVCVCFFLKFIFTLWIEWSWKKEGDFRFAFWLLPDWLNRVEKFNDFCLAVGCFIINGSRLIELNWEKKFGFDSHLDAWLLIFRGNCGGCRGWEGKEVWSGDVWGRAAKEADQIAEEEGDECFDEVHSHFEEMWKASSGLPICRIFDWGCAGCRRGGCGGCFSAGADCQRSASGCTRWLPYYAEVKPFTVWSPVWMIKKLALLWSLSLSALKHSKINLEIRESNTCAKPVGKGFRYAEIFSVPQSHSLYESVIFSGNEWMWNWLRNWGWVNQATMLTQHLVDD